MPCVQRSLCLDVVINDASSTQVEVPKGVTSQTGDMLERCMATCGKAAGARAKMRQMAASKGLDLFHIDLKTAFLQGQSYDVIRDVVCQLPPEAGHPPYIAARLKKLAYGMNDAPRPWWNILDKALRSFGVIPADRCCNVLYSTESRKRTWRH